MKISKLFHWLYASVMMLPLVVAPVYAIFMHRHPVTNYEVTTGGTFDVQPIYQSNQVESIDDLVVGNIYLLNDFYVDEYVIADVAYQYGNNVIFTMNVLSADTMYIGDGGEYDFTYGDYDFIDFYLSFDFFSSNNQICYMNFSSLNTSYQREIENFNLSNFVFYFKDATSLNIFKYLYSLEYFELPVYSDFNLYTGTMTETTTYQDTDIGSQFVYSIYLPLNKYFNVTNFLGLNNLYAWINTNVFSGTAPLGFSIFYMLLSYWLLVSIFWLVFDVVMYVPNLAHRWLDKGSLQ